MKMLLAFLLALAILVVIHEFGHYWVARRCGVKVIRFSFGFGRILWRHTFVPGGTEWVISLIPLGGYVKMLDERDTEETISPADLACAFNRQSLAKRTAIVLAGPLANFILAVLLYWAVAWQGSEEPRAILDTPVAGSPAALANLQNGDEILAVDQTPVIGWSAAQQLLLQGLVSGGAHTLTILREGQELTIQLSVPQQTSPLHLEGNPLSPLGIGLRAPQTVIHKVLPNTPAATAGLQTGDSIVAVNDQLLTWQRSLPQVLQAAGDEPVQLSIFRAGSSEKIFVRVKAEAQDGAQQKRIGIELRRVFPTQLVRYTGLSGLAQGLQQTWHVTNLTLRLLGKMLIGEASLKNLSGPISLADAAGQSAAIGWLPYVLFLAAVSTSLGVFNLLPVPLLDGGHLLYYAAELITGRSPSEQWLEWTQKLGLSLLLALMSLALLNDVRRYFF